MVRTCLLVLLALTGEACAARRPKLTAVGEATEVQGFGATAAKARDVAVANAVEKARELVGAEALSATRVQELLILEVGDAAWSGLLEGEELMVVKVRVELTRELLAAARGADREAVARERQWVLARVVVGLVVAFAVVAGYLRLEEMTKGYATRLLRFAAALIAVLTGLALWLTR